MTKNKVSQGGGLAEPVTTDSNSIWHRNLNFCDVHFIWYLLSLLHSLTGYTEVALKPSRLTLMPVHMVTRDWRFRDDDSCWT